MDRHAANQALAKAIAFKNCGKDKEAAEWARKLVELLECAEILVAEEVSSQECAGCCGTLTRPLGSSSHAYWVCQSCGTAWDPVTGRAARKGCLGCDATLELSDPDICTKCDEHSVIIVSGRAYAPVSG